MILLNSIAIRSLLPADEAFACRVLPHPLPGAGYRIIQRDGGVIFNRKFRSFIFEAS
jgi:hypothetical protein